MRTRGEHVSAVSSRAVSAPRLIPACAYIPLRVSDLPLLIISIDPEYVSIEAYVSAGEIRLSVIPSRRRTAIDKFNVINASRDIPLRNCEVLYPI